MARLRWVLGLASWILAGPWAYGAESPALHELMPKGVRLGVALSQQQTDGKDPHALALARHFNSLTSENILKWEKVHPEPGRYDFEPVDRFVAFGQQRGMQLIGHCLVWHSQTPDWVFAGAEGRLADRETLLGRMREHIQTVVGRYKGRIKGWDVVNEAIGDDGKMRPSKWRQAIGEDYIAKAFEFAREADPQAELYYNDYNLTDATKRGLALQLAKDLKARGLRVDGVGEQGHWTLQRPSLAEIEATITDIAAAGFRVHITEFDMDVLGREGRMFGADLETASKLRAETNLYPDGLPEAKQKELAQQYAEVFKLFLKHRDKLERVTFWGLTDRGSWLNNFPIPGRVNYPLLFDRQGQPKPAFDAVVEVLRAARK